jgi:altronate dehydratase large subunit
MAELTGYRRCNGTWGVRNHVLVMPAQTAAGAAAARLAAAVPGAVAVAHEWEGDRHTADARLVMRTLAGFCANPNVAGVLVVGITHEDAALADAVAARGRNAEFLALADHGGTLPAAAAGTSVLAALVERAGRLRREPMPVSALALGLECGGSDALSGITANPALGIASDLLVAGGGTSILAEVPELVGAEESLAARAVSADVARRLTEVIHRFEAEVRALGVDVRGAQPAPGNIAGGLTTIEEKALGAARKGGEAPLAGVLEYAERPSAPGLHVMDTPGHDIEQMVGMVAGGCQVVAFTTGRGTPTGSPIAPCLKIATNSEVFERMAGDIDLDAGAILDGEQTLESMGRRIYAEILATAGGSLTASERHGHREFALRRTAFPARG